MDKTDILLIYPPFAMPDKPGLSIPVLTGYLKSKGIKTQILDLNIEFYRSFLSKEQIDYGLSHLEKKIIQFKKNINLESSQLIEFNNLKILFSKIDSKRDLLYSLFDNQDSGYTRKIDLFQLALCVASAPYFPERLFFTTNTGYIRYKSIYSNFSSHDILQSLDQDTFFTPFLKHLLTEFFKKVSPRLVGISVSFPDMILPAFRCAKIIKDINSGIHITMGGSFVSVHMRDIKEHRFFNIVDSFILDEGEIPLEKLITGQFDLDMVPGIIYLSKTTKKIIRHKPESPLKLQELPIPDYTQFAIDKYLVGKESMSLLFRLAKGCYWARCSFCRTGLSFINHYNQPPADILYKQIDELIKLTGVRYLHFTDEATSPAILENLCEKIIANKLQINWGTNFRFDNGLTLKRLLLYRKAGCYSASLGLESYCNRVLKLMNKGVSESLVEKILSNFSWAGIDITLYMIVGFPTETEEEAINSFSKILQFKKEGLIKYCVYNIFELVQYSVVAEIPAEFGISKINTIKDRDLKPPITGFDSTGMTRERAFELCGFFVEQLKRSDDKEIN